MKAFFISILAILLIESCKKNTSNTTTAKTCGKTMTEIAGRYKLTKVELVSYWTGATQDVTSTLPTCELSGIFDLNRDSTAVYTEPPGCDGSGTGTWGITGNLYTVFPSGNGVYISDTEITSWDCDNLV